jgi:hypothetical protein
MNSEFDLNELREILMAAREYEPGHHMHRPFMSAYQIAIRFKERHPQHPLEIGGTGTNENTSLAQRIARFMSSEIKKARDEKRDTGIEGGFFSHESVKEISFQDSSGRVISVSTLESKPGHSIFRVR